MPTPTGLREQKKVRTRERLADVAAALFAERGYDGVSVLDVARAADVSDQTVYNYFPAKHDLALDRADAILERYVAAVRDRPPGTTPAAVVRPLVLEDVDRIGENDPLAPGEFAVLCLRSPELRRRALEFRERQGDALAAVIVTTTPDLHPLVARTHAAALVALLQWVTDQVGASVLDPGPAQAVTARRAVEVALDDLDRHFRALTGSV